ncbi:MAG: hypothetical protein CBARDMAM_4377 [uncultured Caballeronia sp.]|nr:MAG: hypothetical protein CBARDMAM_4377 [uncultured Caballeronia sp.]
MIGGQNGQVAQGAMVVTHRMLNTLSSKPVSVSLPVLDDLWTAPHPSYGKETSMKHFSMASTIGAVLCISSAAFPQNNPPSSSTGLQASNNAQTTNQSAGTTANPGMSHPKKMKHTQTSSTGSKTSMGTATLSGPGAPVTASGSGG